MVEVLELCSEKLEDCAVTVANPHPQHLMQPMMDFQRLILQVLLPLKEMKVTSILVGRKSLSGVMMCYLSVDLGEYNRGNN
jgi:hypothetical protein